MTKQKKEGNNQRWIRRYINERLWFIANKSERTDAAKDIAKYVDKHYEKKQND